MTKGRTPETTDAIASLNRGSTLDFFFVICGLALLPATWMALDYPPPDIAQGQAQRIFYVHVPIAWVALYAPILSAATAILYLLTRRDEFDLWSLVSARIALLFAAGVVISGPLWASTEWGTYWNWHDSRLMSFFILLLSLIAYFLARNSVQGTRQKIVAALLSIFSALSAVLTWFAIRLIEPDLHPTSVLGKMEPEMRTTFWLSVLAYHLFFLTLMRISLRHQRIANLSNLINDNRSQE